MMPMIDHNKDITLDEAIAHFEAIDACARIGGEQCPIHSQLAWYLRRLKRYEEAIEKGELVWLEEMPKKRPPAKKPRATKKKDVTP